MSKIYEAEEDQEAFVGEKDYIEQDLVIVTDTDGDYAVGKTVEEAQEAYANEYGEVALATETTIIKLKRRRPKVTALSAILPDNESGEYKLELKQA